MDQLNKITAKTISGKLASELSRTYNVLDTKPVLINLIHSILNTNVNKFTKFELHSLINSLVLKNYTGESRIKSLLVNHFINEDAVAAFEINTSNSRLDFLRVNGNTISYEIKSEVDSLQKLIKQTDDYEQIFEFNYVVLDAKHLQQVKKLVSDRYGIYIIKQNQLICKRKAKKSNRLNSLMQLSLFTKKELRSIFDGCDNRILLDDKYSKQHINKQFKKMLKKRYFKKWEFLKCNLTDILPLDYQYFFNHNIDPLLVYGD